MIRGKLLVEAATLNPTAVIDLFQLDLRPVGAVPVEGFNGIFYFHSGNEPWRSDVVFQGVVYPQWPVETKNFEWTSTATQPRPQISFSNILGPFTQLNMEYGGLINARLTRIRTFGKFLDYMPQADPSAYFPPETWAINRKIQEDKEVCAYELANPMDIEDLALPRRVVLADQCRWLYRGDGCFYTGAALFDVNDQPLPYAPHRWRGGWAWNTSYWYGDMVVAGYSHGANAAWIPQYFICVYPSTNQPPPSTGNSPYWQRDECSLRLQGCKLRFGPKTSQFGGALPFGGFPGVELNPVQTGGGV
jgi:lambda family phage minor tail protein L